MASKGKSARNKGHSFERRICKDLTAWSGITFSRSPMSGGWSKTGDVTPKDPEDMTKWLLNIECKNCEAYNTPQIFRIRSEEEMPKVFHKWWQQSVEDSGISGRIPFLVFTKNRDEVYCMMRRGTFDRFSYEETKMPFFVANNMVIVLWEDFLKIPYGSVQKCFQQETE